MYDLGFLLDLSYIIPYDLLIRISLSFREDFLLSFSKFKIFVMPWNLSWLLIISLDSLSTIKSSLPFKCLISEVICAIKTFRGKYLLIGCWLRILEVCGLWGYKFNTFRKIPEIFYEYLNSWHFFEKKAVGHYFPLINGCKQLLMSEFDQRLPLPLRVFVGAVVALRSASLACSNAFRALLCYLNDLLGLLFR